MAATDPEEDYSYFNEEEEGGPRKTFLEHLEDLRWTLMKCVSVIAIGFMACLFAAPYLIKALVWPLEHSGVNEAMKNPRVTLLVGTNRLGTFNLDTNQPIFFGTNTHTVLEMVPFNTGSNVLLALQPSTNAAAAAVVSRPVNLINLGPASAFFLTMKLAIYGAIAIGLPFLLYFIGQFVFPALKMNEKKYIFWGLGIGSALFFLGAAFCYFGMMPIALRGAVQYSQWVGFNVTDWRAEEYISFVTKFIFGMGIAFELPVVILVLVKIGLLDYEKLAGFRTYMVVVNLVIAAILTPPDVITQIMMFVPLQLLYEVSVWIAWYWARQDRKKAQALQ